MNSRSPTALRTTFRWLLTTPWGACIALLVSALPAWLFPDGALVTFVVALIFSVYSPVLCVLRSAWWLGSLCSAIALVTVIVVISESPSVHRMREGGMIFLLPIMLLPWTMALSGAARFVLWWKRRAR